METSPVSKIARGSTRSRNSNIDWKRTFSCVDAKPLGRGGSGTVFEIDAKRVIKVFADDERQKDLSREKEIFDKWFTDDKGQMDLSREKEIFDKWFTNEKINEGEKYHKLASMTEHRKERILWLSCQLASLDYSIYDPRCSLFSLPDSFHKGWGMDVTGMEKIIENTAYYQHAMMLSKSAHNGHDPGDTTNAQKKTSLFDLRKIIWRLLPTFGNGKACLRISKSCTSRLGISVTT